MEEIKKKRKSPGAPNLKLVVSEETIKDSLSQDSSHCMLAEALKKAYPEGTSIAVDLQTIRVSNPKKRLRYTYLTPRLAQVALIKFDQGMMPDPFDVTLRNGQVTKMSTSSTARAVKRADKVIKGNSEEVKKAAMKNLEKAKAVNPLKRAVLVERKVGSGMVPDRIGGQTPPLQRTKDNIPFSRRRAFGLRGMKM